MKQRALLIVLLLITLFNCNRDMRSKNRLNSSQSDKDSERIILCLTPYRSELEMLNIWQPFADYLSRESGYNVELEFAEDYEHLITDFSNKSIELALLGSFAYVSAREQRDVLPLAQMVIHNTTGYRSLLIVSKDSPFTSISDLKGKSIAFVDKKSTSGYLLPLYMLAQAGVTAPEESFSSIVWAGTHDNARRLVHTGKVEAAFITSIRWKPFDNNPLLDELKVIDRSETIPLGPLCIRADLDSDIGNNLKKALLKIDIKNSETRELAQLLMIDKFTDSKDDNYNYIRLVKERLLELGISPED